MAKDKYRIVLEVEGDLKQYFKDKAASEERSVNYYISNILREVKEKEDYVDE